MERSTWAWMPAAALLLCGVGASRAFAQAPVPPSPMPSTVNPLAGPTLGPPPFPPSAGGLPGTSPALGGGSGTGGRSGQPAFPLPPALPGTSGPQPPVRLPGTPAGANPVARPEVNPLATGMRLRPVPYESTDLRFPISLAAALRLADARPLIVAAAQAGVWVAEAQLLRAKVLWIPTLNIGFDYLRHDGGGPDFNKGIMTAPSVNFFYGGAGMWGVLSGTDIIFQPLAARQYLNSAHWGIQYAKNEALLQTAMAYFSVHQYRGMYAGGLYVVERGHELVDRIANLSREFVPRVEVDRARNLLAELEQQTVYSRQEWRVASANLTQVLRLDPRCRRAAGARPRAGHTHRPHEVAR